MQHLGTKVYLLKRYSPSDSFCTFFLSVCWTVCVKVLSNHYYTTFYCSIYSLYLGHSSQAGKMAIISKSGTANLVMVLHYLVQMSVSRESESDMSLIAILLQFC